MKNRTRNLFAWSMTYLAKAMHGSRIDAGRERTGGLGTNRWSPLTRKRFRMILEAIYTTDSLQEFSMAKSTYRVVTRAADGTIRIREYPSTEPLAELHTQVGIDDCSTDLSLRGLPVFRGLIGPMPEGKGIIRYESPEVFETLTKEWSTNKPKRRSRRRVAESAGSLEQLPLSLGGSVP